MQFTFNNRMLEKLEAILTAFNYKVRYEKGNFKTGACLIEKNRVVVVNKFSDLESKIRALALLIKDLKEDEPVLSGREAELYQALKQPGELF